MKKEILREIKGLLFGERVLALAVLRGGLPYVGLLPYVVSNDASSATVHVSGLAIHSQGLTEGAPVSVLIHAADTPEADPLQIRRITLTGRATVIPRGSARYADERARYVSRFPDSAPTFELGDFSLYRLQFEEGRYVGGFARARTLGPKDIAALRDV